MKLSDLKNCNYFIITVLIMIVIFKFASSSITNVLYKEVEISGESIVDNPAFVNDFEVNGNTVISENSDPQIFLIYSQYDIFKIKEISIDIEYLSVENEEAEIFALDSVESYNVLGCSNINLTEGVNKILIPESGYKDGALRLDLATHPGVEIKINNIVVNDSSYITEISNNYFVNFVYVLVLILLGIFSIKLGARNYIYSAGSYCAGFFLLLISTAIYFLFEPSVLKEVSILLAGVIPLCQIMSLVAAGIDKTFTKIQIKLKNTNALNILFALFLIFEITALMFMRRNLHGIIYLCFLYMFGHIGKGIEFNKKQKIFSVLFTVLICITMYALNVDYSFRDYDIYNKGYCAFIIIEDIALSFVAILWFDKINCTNQFKYLEKKNLCYSAKSYKSKLNVELKKSVFDNIVSLIIIAVALSFAEICIRTYMSENGLRIGLESALIYLGTDVFFFNLLFLYLIAYFLKSLLGKRTSNVLLVIVLISYLIGSFLKLKYHGTVLQLIDFLLVKEIFLIAEAFVGKIGYYIIIALLITVVICILINIKKIVRYLKPKCSIIYAILMIVPLLQVVYILNNNMLSNIDVDFENVWIDEKTKFSKDGIMLYNYNNINNLLNLYPKEPEEYSSEYMNELKTSFDEIKNYTESDIKPDVIVIMAESYFDITQIEEFNLSEDVVYPYRKYGNGHIMSPKYGGGTAAVEFEALTGFSNMFLLNEVIAYTTYMRSGNVKFPAIPWEFNESGYETIVMHPNSANFYNRNNAYEAMGFNKYYSIEDFDKEGNTLNDGYYKDKAFGEKLIEIASDDSKPQFIFGITIEGHSPYENKYKDDEFNIDVTSDTVNGSQLKQVKEFAQSLNNTSDMIEDVIEYVENTDRPTLLYIFGDHLPPIDCIAKMDVSLNIWTRYATPLMTYSNYKDIEIGSDYISPCQLASQVLIDAGIKHSSYFDYIYSIRSKYPILKREFIDNMDTEEIKKYNIMQYDLMFGERYLINKEN